MDKRSYCKKHPTHKQSKGVCPYCLGEKLSNLTITSSSTTILCVSNNNSSTVYSSPHSSNPNMSPPCQYKVSISNEGEEKPLKKSRSLAFVMEEEEEKEKKKKKRKFWSKLVGKRKEEALMHSKTTKEKSSTKWVGFS